MVNSSSLHIHYIFFTYTSIFGIQVVLTPWTVKVDAINMVVQLFPQDSCFNPLESMFKLMLADK